MFILLSFLSLFFVASPSYGNLLSVWFRIVQRPSLHFDLILFNQQYHFPWFDDLWTGRHSSLFIGPVWCHFSNILAISECTIRNISFGRVKRSKTEREKESCTNFTTTLLNWTLRNISYRENQGSKSLLFYRLQHWL